MKNDHTLLDVSQLAMILNLKVSKIRQMIFRGEIKPIKIGRLLRFHREDVQHFINSKRDSLMKKGGHS